MKIYLDRRVQTFHNDYYDPIEKELIKRGHEITDKNPDFVIGADEAHNARGFGEAKCVFIGHSFDAKGACYNGRHEMDKLNQNADYIFTYSKWYKEWFKSHIGTEVHVTGMPKLDGLFNVEKISPCILYAPTFNPELSSWEIMENSINTLSQFGRLIIRRHPAKFENEISLNHALRKATIVISDYSSVGMEAIVLNIPTILIKTKNHKQYQKFPPDHYITNRARQAAIECENFSEVKLAVKKYLKNPKFLENKRSVYGKLLCEHQNESSIITVNKLEKIYERGDLQKAKTSS